MRHAAIALLFVGFLPAVFVADDSPPTESQQERYNFAGLPSGRLLDHDKGNQTARKVYDGFLADLLDGAGDHFCLAMRTYFVKQENPQSDTTRLVGYTTCQPGSTFRVKVAVEGVIDSR